MTVQLQIMCEKIKIKEATLISVCSFELEFSVN